MLGSTCEGADVQGCGCTGAWINTAEPLGLLCCAALRDDSGHLSRCIIVQSRLPLPLHMQGRAIACRRTCQASSPGLMALTTMHGQIVEPKPLHLEICIDTDCIT